ncbi:glycosyltransferase family 2 protein [Rhizosphaericola mali]|uniref:Glycosyltransferase family 2 protein n=1 Tax=Rhizosphaericola mali TaxID=2545455 RepID=A0A5P2G590_9BACT|nr:glycosyltransferase family 2 protein [Rhizosphaericola mali]QES89309.1 glycosyltransferase family 2 protein [Rhizosphaericola mali]
MISVCLATYNGSKYIIEQIKSILSQLSPNDELIISDDRSTDNTIDLIKEINDSRIKLFVNSGVSGVSHNFENALKRALGDYIFLSDQDDIWEKNKISATLPLLINNVCILHNARIIDNHGKFTNKTLFSVYKTRTGFFNNLIRNTFVGCCMAFRRDMLQYILPIPNNVTMHDMWIALICHLNGNVILVDSELLQYRRHDNNASTTGNKSKFSKSYQLQYRLQILYSLIKRHYIKN